MTRIFRDVATEFIEAKFSPASQKLSLARMKAYAFPALGKLQLQSVEADAIAAALRPIWLTKPETARRTRQLIIRTLRYGRPDGALLESTLAKAVSDRLPAQPRRGNFAALPYEEIPALMSRLIRTWSRRLIAVKPETTDAGPSTPAMASRIWAASGRNRPSSY